MFFRFGRLPAAIVLSIAWGAAASAETKAPDQRDRIDVHAFTIDALTVPIRQDGVYDRLFASLFASLEGAFDVRYSVYPALRVEKLRHGRAGESFCETPTDLTLLELDGADPENFIQTGPFNSARLHAFVRRGRDAPTSLETMPQPFGIVRGLAGSWLPELLAPLSPERRVYQTRDLNQLVRMLDHGRIETAIAYLPDMGAILKQPDHALVFDETFVISETLDRVACWNTPATARFVEAMDRETGRAAADGRLERILGDYWLPPRQRRTAASDAPGEAR